MPIAPIADDDDPIDDDPAEQGSRGERDLPTDPQDDKPWNGLPEWAPDPAARQSER